MNRIPDSVLWIGKFAFAWPMLAFGLQLSPLVAPHKTLAVAAFFTAAIPGAIAVVGWRHFAAVDEILLKYWAACVICSVFLIVVGGIARIWH